MPVWVGQNGTAFAGCFSVLLASAGCAASQSRPPVGPVPVDSTISAASSAAANPATYFEFQIEKPATRRPETGYPKRPIPDADSARVVAQFVVDTAGVPVLQTFKVLKMSSRAAAVAVYAALKTMRYFPAEIGGKRVNQLVQELFTF